MVAAIAFILLVYAYSLLSRRLTGTVLTLPLVFTQAGVVLFLVAPEQIRRDVAGWAFAAAPRPWRAPAS